MRLATDPRSELSDGNICANCYRLMFENFERNFIKEVYYDEDAQEYRTDYDPVDGLPSERLPVADNVDPDVRAMWCECGSDGAAQYRGKLTMPEVRRYTENAAETLSQLGFDLDPSEAVARAVELKKDDELGDDDMIIEAVRYAIRS